MRAIKGRVTGEWLARLARKSSVSCDWLVWLCRETPVRNPAQASLSLHRYEMDELGIRASVAGGSDRGPSSPRIFPQVFHNQYPGQTVNIRLIGRELPFNSRENQ